MRLARRLQALSGEEVLAEIGAFGVHYTLRYLFSLKITSEGEKITPCASKHKRAEVRMKPDINAVCTLVRLRAPFGSRISERKSTHDRDICINMHSV